MAGSIPHVQIRHATFWFRRRIPTSLIPVIGRREFTRTLSTSSPQEAKRRSCVCWLETERIFQSMSENLNDELKVADLVQELDKCLRTMDQMQAVMESQQRAFNMLKTASEISALQSDIKISELTAKLSEANESGALKDMVISTTDHTPKLKKSPKLTVKLKAWVEELHKPNDNGKITTEQVIHQNLMTIRLWSEFFNDKPVREYTKEQAQEFKHQLSKLPANHGKSRSHIVSAPQAIKENQDSPNPKPCLTAKTIKRHFSALSSYWDFLLQAGQVDENIFLGHKHKGAKSKRSQRDMWSNDDLKRLINEYRFFQEPDRKSGYFWLPLVAMFSGMRLEEIARLRPIDIEQHGDHWVFNIQEHPDGWSPKSEAGERIVPIHSMLHRMGFMDLVQSRIKDARIFYDLQPSGVDKKYGCKFSREFSRLKMRMQISRKTTFHSFRHSVRTILDNTDEPIREAWINDLLGHEHDETASVGLKTYHKLTQVQNLCKVINALKYDDEITSLLSEKFC